jgi:ribonuclease D
VTAFNAPVSLGTKGKAVKEYNELHGGFMIHWIEDDEALATVCTQAMMQERVALDTEFILERTYYAQLALIQLAWNDREAYLIDPLKIHQWAPFWAFLREEKVKKVLHSGRQDILIFHYLSGECPRNLWDTQVAASFLGFGEQIGYGNLVSALLRINLDKGHSYSDWLKRPLSPQQINYAANDVTYLSTCFDRLWHLAEKKQRLTWIEEELSSSYHPDTLSSDPGKLWQRVKRSGPLRPAQINILQELAAWREQRAQNLNLPIRHVIRDETLLAWAKRKQLTESDFQNDRGNASRLNSQDKRTIMELHAQAQDRPRELWPALPDIPDKAPAETQAIAELCWGLLRQIAQDHQISPSLLILKRDMIQVIDTVWEQKPRRHPFFSGWRYAMAGEPLVGFLEGRLGLTVNRQSLRLAPLKDTLPS